MVDRDWTVEGVGRSREVREEVIVTCVGGGGGRREVDSGGFEGRFESLCWPIACGR